MNASLLLLVLLACTSDKVEDGDGTPPGPDGSGDGSSDGSGDEDRPWCSGEAARTPDGRAFDTVWDAVDAADEGDRVEVCPGTWTGRVEISRSIELVGDSDGGTILDAGGEGSTISIMGGEEVVLRHLTLTGGTGTENDDGERWGGGLLVVNTLYLEASDLEISGNSADGGAGAWIQGVSYGIAMEAVRFVDNTGTVFAGGLGIAASDGASLVDLELTGNTAEFGGGLAVSDLEKLQLFESSLADNVADHGGGFYAAFLDELQVKESTFTRNEGRLTGGGMLVQESIEVSLDDSTFEDNTASEGAGAGAFFGDNEFVEVDDCRFSGGTAHHEAGLAFNSAWGDGGGGAALDGVEITNNTAQTYGGGLTVWALDLFLVEDGVVRGNTALDGAGGGLFLGNVTEAGIVGSQLVANEAATTGGGAWLENSVFAAADVDARENAPDDLATEAGAWSLEDGALICDATGACD